MLNQKCIKPNTQQTKTLLNSNLNETNMRPKHLLMGFTGAETQMLQMIDSLTMPMHQS